jgi:hypothetical protein
MEAMRRAINAARLAYTASEGPRTAKALDAAMAVSDVYLRETAEADARAAKAALLRRFANALTAPRVEVRNGNVVQLRPRARP